MATWQYLREKFEEKYIHKEMSWKMLSSFDFFCKMIYVNEIKY